MKKISLLAFLLFTGFILVNSHSQFTAFSAGQETPPAAAPNRNENSADQNRAAQEDRQLATLVRKLTNRSTEGLTEKRSPAGGFSIDLEERFQNVMLSRIEPDGESHAACIASPEEANAFFGRNLETGEIVASDAFRKDKTAAAARHGMSPQEFEFYKKLIEDAIARSASSPGSATINIVNSDGAGEGFNDTTAAAPEGGNNGATLGQQRLNLFNFAAAIWGAYLDSGVTINVNSQFNELTCSANSAVLGSAGTTSIYRDFTNAEFPGTWFHVALASKRTGIDLNNVNPEINAIFNSRLNGDAGCLGGQRFYLGFDNSTPFGTTNLLIVLLHEMAHGLGFSSFVNGTSGAFNSGFPDIYSRYMYDRTVNKYWFEMTNAERQASAINPNNVLWDGPNVKIASGFLLNGIDTTTGRVQLYTPSTFAGGSSISHFSTSASPNLLMEPNINAGLPLTLDLTRQQMRDIGWYRDTTADLVPDTITNVLPSGGTIVIGSTRNITWTNTGGFDRNVTIELSIDGGATYPTTIASNIANTGSFSFTVPNSPTTQGRIRVRENGFVAPLGASSFNFAIATTAPPNRTAFDFDGDGRADVSTFRPDTGIWYLQQSQNGFTGAHFGTTGDRIVPADFDGDGKTDLAVFRSGTWFVQRSSQGFTGVAFGAATDTPAPADFDGDGKAELAVYRPSNGTWYFYNLATNQTSGVAFGAAEDKAVPADYDGDGRADVAVFRPSNGTWYIQRSQLGFTGAVFGVSEDKAVPADYDGDGKADIAVFRPSSGTWFLNRSQLGFTGIAFGLGTDAPAPADYDGDGKTDVAVFRSGTWYLQRSSQGLTGVAFGATTDLPVPNAFVR